MSKVHLKNYEKFQCEKCSGLYNSKEYLKLHLRTVHKETEDEELICELCNKVFRGEFYLKKHIRISHKRPLKVCQICGKTVRDMPLHLLTHGEKSVQCSVCQKMFTSKRQMEVHKRIHTGKKPYKCKHCGQAFTQAGTRKIHERIHTNERPFICEGCGKGFTSASVMNVHKKKCRGIF
ncbi:zinc finger protein 239-like [Atheta coriaria]|uniref:zinc finger protein 239-like n=1 Tax=Dalotia coriaria TaxID=877792 RepID=UPI0031F352BF